MVVMLRLCHADKDSRPHKLLGLAGAVNVLMPCTLRRSLSLGPQALAVSLSVDLVLELCLSVAAAAEPAIAAITGQYCLMARKISAMTIWASNPGDF